MNKGNPKRPKPKAESSMAEKSSKPKAQSRKQRIVGSETKKESTAHKPVASQDQSEIKDSKSEIKKLPTEPMEVHHHPQLEHNPKPWKEYLLEGFMIFIAVMMGFIAENIREDISNKEHVRHLTVQLVRDLKADTGQINVDYKGVADMLKSNDTLFAMLQQPMAKIDFKKLQLLIANAHSIFLFHPAMGAIGAIKNEIHLKQFANSNMVGYIADYERHIELVHTIQDILMQYQRTYLDPFISSHLTPANLDNSFSDKPVLTSQMRNLNQADLTQLAADMVLIKISLREQLRDSNFIKNDIVNMLKYVKEHYHPEE